MTLRCPQELSGIFPEETAANDARAKARKKEREEDRREKAKLKGTVNVDCIATICLTMETIHKMKLTALQLFNVKHVPYIFLMTWMATQIAASAVAMRGRQACGDVAWSLVEGAPLATALLLLLGVSYTIKVINYLHCYSYSYMLLDAVDGAPPLYCYLLP